MAGSSTLKQLLKTCWPRVRKRHLYPELKYPRFDGEEAAVGLNLIGKQITLATPFVEHLAAVMEPAQVIEGLLDHGIAHHVCCPWNFSTHLQLHAKARETLYDDAMGKRAADLFMDVVADSYCVSRMETSLPSIYRHLDKTPLDELLCALYQQKWDLDLGVTTHVTLARRLATIPFGHRKSWLSGMDAFAKLLRPYLEREKKAGRIGDLQPLGRHTLSQFTLPQIDEGLRTLAAECSSPHHFRRLLHPFQEELQQLYAAGGGEKQTTPAPDSMDPVALYYQNLAAGYRLPIRKKPLQPSGSFYPHSHIRWEVGKPCTGIDPWASFGKIMPGITQVWQQSNGNVFARGRNIPDCIVLIDSSGSMQNPRNEISFAVLGAVCAADAYFRNGSRVAVYNFGDAEAGNCLVLPYTRERRAVFGALCHYYSGDTRCDLQRLETLQTPGHPDIFIISDMRIANLSQLIQYLDTSRNRITAVHMGSNPDVRRLCETMAHNSRVGIFAVEELKAIPAIVLGQIKGFWNALA